MDILGKAKRVRIYVNDGDKVGHRPTHLALLELLRKENAQGATVLRAIEGFGAAGQIHTMLLVDVAHDLPLVVEWIDKPEVVERLIGRVKAMVPHGLITVDETDVVFFDPHPIRDIPAALLVRDVMTAKVTGVSTGTAMREVVELMLGRVYRALPVVENGVPVGIITNGDLVLRGGLDVRVDLFSALESTQRDEVLARLASASRTARDVMTPAPVTVEAGAPLVEAAELMAQRRLKRLPVVDGRGALVGMVSRLDLLRAASSGYAEKEPLARDLGLRADVPIGRLVRRDVPTVHPETPLPEVFQAVISTRLNRALVVDADRRVVGLVTDAEVLERITPSLRPGALRSLMSRLPFANPEGRAAERHAHARRASDLMSKEVPTVTEDTLVADAIGTMLRGNHKVLAVVDATARLVGIVDRADLLHGLVRHG